MVEEVISNKEDNMSNDWMEIAEHVCGIELTDYSMEQ